MTDHNKAHELVRFWFMIYYLLFYKQESMEGILKNSVPSSERENNIENLADWRERKERAPEQAQARIDDIEGFENKSAKEKVQILTEIKDELAEENNKNLYIDRVLANRIATIMDVSNHEREELGLPLRSPYENLQKPQESADLIDFPTEPPSDYQERNGYPTRRGDGVKVDEVAEIPPGVRKHKEATNLGHELASLEKAS